jgi:multicomponent Na+:H+ antiporter subunit D
MTDISIVLPVLLPLMIAIFLLFFWGKVQSQKWISILGSIGVLGYSIWLFAKVYSGGLLTMQAGNWEAPFGITLVADVFSVTMILLTSIAGLAVSIFSAASISSSRIRFGYFPILHLLLMGLNGLSLRAIFSIYTFGSRLSLLPHLY